MVAGYGLGPRGIATGGPEGGQASRPTYNRRAGVEQIPSRMRFLRGQVAHGKGPGRMRLPLMTERLRSK